MALMAMVLTKRWLQCNAEVEETSKRDIDSNGWVEENDNGDRNEGCTQNPVGDW